MKIYLDGLFYKGSGIGRYYESITKELAKKDVEVITSVPKKLKNNFEKDFASISNIKPIFVDYEKFSLKGFWKQSSILKNLEKKVDLFFYPHINLPFYVPENTIVTIHDLRPFTEWWNRDEFKRKIYKILMKKAVLKSKKIISISKATKNNLIHYYEKFNIENKIEVIYEFIDDKFINYKKPEKALISEDYILFVGNRKKHKNLKNLVLAFDKIKDKINCKLVIAGKKDTGLVRDEIDELIQKLSLKDFVIEYLNPDDEGLINLYGYAQLFVFPSFYEGFGLPPLEAISCNCPTITSNIPVLKEVLGEKIACFNPYSIEDIAEKIISVLEDENKKKELLSIGKKRLKFFNKDKIINEYLNIFHKIL